MAARGPNSSFTSERMAPRFDANDSAGCSATTTGNGKPAEVRVGRSHGADPDTLAWRTAGVGFVHHVIAANGPPVTIEFEPERV